MAIIDLPLPAPTRAPARGRDRAALGRRIATRAARVGVVGLGYAGLPLALEFARAGFPTLGLEIDAAKAAAINAGRSPVSSVANEAVAALVADERLAATVDVAAIAGLDCVVVCVPTPLGPEGGPDTSAIAAAMRTVAARLRPHALVVLQSSCAPGCTRTVVQGALAAAGWRVGEDCYLAYAPERIDPGNARFGVANTPKLVGGISPACADLAASLFGAIVATVVRVDSPEVAELAKLVENSFRFINISFANELALLCDQLGLNVWDVIDAAATKPFAFMAHYPGPGVGGDCIPVTPLYLAWRAEEVGAPMAVIRAAQRTNDDMPRRVVAKLGRLLAERFAKPLAGARVLVVGASYKPNVADLRHAPSLALLRELRFQGAVVAYHDPLVPMLCLDGEELSSVNLAASPWDAAILATPHRGLAYDALLASCPLLLDTQNALRDRAAPNVVRL